jgi:hypothetical protein
LALLNLALETFNLTEAIQSASTYRSKAASSEDEILSQDIEEAVVMKAVKKHNPQSK